MSDTSRFFQWESVAVDLDGTLVADTYPELGEPVPEMVALLRRWSSAGVYIIIASSRHMGEHEHVRAWLNDNAIPYDNIVLGAKPPARMFVDDLGLLAPSHALEAIAERRWRADWGRALAGGELTSRWAVEQYEAATREGTPPDESLYKDDRFRLVVPVSGGLDSTAVYHMAKDRGAEVEAVYIDAGQPYASDEMAALSDMDIHPTLIEIPPSPVDTGTHVFLGRNARIVVAIADMLKRRGLWGEVWFGNVMGESHVVGGDKSSRFFGTLQAMLHADGHDVRIVNPLVGMEKTDIVHWYMYTKREGLLSKIRPCLSAGGSACGHCQTCAKMIFAMEYVGYDWTKLYPASVDIQKHAKKYKVSMVEEPGRYAPKQIRETLGAIRQLEKKGVI